MFLTLIGRIHYGIQLVTEGFKRNFLIFKRKKAMSPRKENAAFNKVKERRAKERRAAQSRRTTILGVDVPTNDAAIRLSGHFKLLDQFKASSMSRGGKKVAR